jgi:hypothetical protein
MTSYQIYFSFESNEKWKSAVWIVADSGGRTMEHSNVRCLFLEGRCCLTTSLITSAKFGIASLSLCVRQSVFPHGTPLLSPEEFL